MKFAEWANSSLLQQTVTIMLSLLTSLLAWKPVKSTCNVSYDFCEYTKRNTENSHLVYLALMRFVFPRLCIDVVKFCSKFASRHSLCRKKAKLGQP